MPTLPEILTGPQSRPKVIADAQGLIDREVATKSGVSGLAIKSAYKVLKGVRPGMVGNAVDALLDDFAVQLDPYYQQSLIQARPLTDVLVEQRDQMADDLLEITDRRAERTSHATVRRAYRQVRGQAKKHVEVAAPGIADLIERNCDR